MNAKTFSFADHAPKFEDHIEASIPGYRQLQDRVASVSMNYVQDRTNVVDVGCSAGSLLAKVRDKNNQRRPAARYFGIDREQNFEAQWKNFQQDNLSYLVREASEYSGFENLSFVSSVFTVQFLPESEKLPLLRKIYSGLIPGGALIIAEKILASSARLQDVLTFQFYDYKRRNFGAEEILDKEMQLRGQMTSWTREELLGNLKSVGFNEIEVIWDSFPFTAVLAIKTGRSANFPSTQYAEAGA